MDNDLKESMKSCQIRDVIQYEMTINNILCDAKIKLDDESVFNVHRIVLSSCSDYFRALFTTLLNQDITETLLPGIKKSIMQKIIQYAYLRKCDINKENIFELYVAADYIGMIGLMKMCADFLLNTIDINNCIGLLLFARIRFCRELEERAYMFILRNYVAIAEKSNELLKLEFKDFNQIISDDMLNAKDEEPVWLSCLNWINYDKIDRLQYLTKLMRGVRLGLLNRSFFEEHVKNNVYVKDCEEARPIIIETLRFLYNINARIPLDYEDITPPLAIPRFPHEIIFAIGGWGQGSAQKFIESYDTRADRWNPVPEEDPAGERAYHGTAVIRFKIYCIGGYDGVEYFNSCRVFDAEKKIWEEIAPMHSIRCYVSVTELNGLIYALGGFDGESRHNSAEKYDPQTNQWTKIAPMNEVRSDAHACTLNGKVYITGGFNGHGCINTAEYYDPEKNTWTLITNMISRRSGVACIAHRNSIYVIGGFNGLVRTNTCERYDPLLNTWSPIREMNNPRSNFGIEIIDDMIFVMGGYNGVSTIPYAECYVAETDEWLEATDMLHYRSALSANVIMGLPNVRDYIHKDRERLMEDRRLRMYGGDAEDAEHWDNFGNGDNNSSEEEF